MLYVTTLNRTEFFVAWARCICGSTVTIDADFHDADCENCRRIWFQPDAAETLLICETSELLAIAAEV